MSSYNELGRVPFYFILCKSLCKIGVIFLSIFGKEKKITGETIRPWVFILVSLKKKKSVLIFSTDLSSSSLILSSAMSDLFLNPPVEFLILVLYY